MLFYESKITDPAINLATEEILFRQTNEPVFMLWQNDKSVILGQYQNAYEEVNFDYIKKHEIRLVRRMTGGGAVYHDLGNVNFSFIRTIESQRKFDFESYMSKMTEALCAMGVPAQMKGRNDIMVEEKKVSGNAQHISGNRVLHHGTLLFDSDLMALQKALKGEDHEIESNADPSNRQKVINIRQCFPEDLNVTVFKRKISEAVLQGESVTYLSSKWFSSIFSQIRTLVSKKYGNWDWNIGGSPKCRICRTCRWPKGHMRIQMDINDGVINEFYLEGDYFAGEMLDTTINQFIGRKLQRDDLQEVAEQCTEVIHGLSADLLLECILTKSVVQV